MSGLQNIVCTENSAAVVYFINNTFSKSFSDFVYLREEEDNDCYVMNITGHTLLTGRCEYTSSDCTHCNATGVHEINWTTMYLIAKQGNNILIYYIFSVLFTYDIYLHTDCNHFENVCFQLLNKANKNKCYVINDILLGMIVIFIYMFFSHS